MDIHDSFKACLLGGAIGDALGYPTLATADVGMAMGTGTDVAMESASVTLMRGDLKSIASIRNLTIFHRWH